MPPIALAAIGIATAVGGAVAGAAGHAAAGNAIMDAANTNANIDTEKAQISEDQQRLKDRTILARGRALVGASGVELSGSPLDVMAENARQAEMNALIIRRGGQLSAQADIAAGKAGQVSQQTQIGTTLLTGAATTATNIGQLKALL